MILVAILHIFEFTVVTSYSRFESMIFRYFLNDDIVEFIPTVIKMRPDKSIVVTEVSRTPMDKYRVKVKAIDNFLIRLLSANLGTILA